jgi:hypothetical protein
MSGGRAERWVIGDLHRLLNRARKSNGGVIAVEELWYLRDQCVLLRYGPLASELPDHSCAQIDQLLRDVLCALQEHAGEQIEDGKP